MSFASPLDVASAKHLAPANRELDALNGHTSSSAPTPILPVQRSHPTGPTYRMRIHRKRSLDMSSAPEAAAGMWEERYSSRQEAFDELDGGGMLKGLLQKEVLLFLVELRPHEFRRDGGSDVPCSFCPWFRVRGLVLACVPLSQRGAPRHMQRDQTAARNDFFFFFQCDLCCGRRLADYLRRSADLIWSSVGDLSCPHRLNVDKEFRFELRPAFHEQGLWHQDTLRSSCREHVL